MSVRRLPLGIKLQFECFGRSGLGFWWNHDGMTTCLTVLEWSLKSLYTSYYVFVWCLPEFTPSQMLHCKTSWWFQRLLVLSDTTGHDPIWLQECFLKWVVKKNTKSWVNILPWLPHKIQPLSHGRDRYASTHPNAKLINVAVLPSENPSKASVVQAFYIHPDAWCGFCRVFGKKAKPLI